MTIMPDPDDAQDDSQCPEWERLEEHVKRVYNMLLHLEGEKTVVQRDIKLRGRDGLPHQIDVYYEFVKAGLRHRVAIECRNKGRRVDKDQVMAFTGKVRDIPGVQGVIVSLNGYQYGAQKYADDNGLTALSVEQLPNIREYLSYQYDLTMRPDEQAIGEPFWTVYRLTADGQNEGTPLVLTLKGQPTVLLFISKPAVLRFLRHAPASGYHYGARGLTQRALKGFILQSDHLKTRFALVDAPDVGTPDFMPTERDELISEFVVDNTQWPAVLFLDKNLSDSLRHRLASS